MKSLDWTPPTGPLDNRSVPSQMPPQSYRRLLNVWVPAAFKLARRYGWEKLFPADDYNNSDLHDQLLALQTYYDVLDDSVPPEDILSLPNAACDVTINTRTTGRQPITMLHSFESTLESRTLLAGTESRIYALNGKNGNWRLLADGLGEGIDDGTCPRRRFYCSTNVDTAIFVNDFNKVLYWIYGSGPNGCDQQSVRPIPEMDLIGVSRASVTWTWKYVSFVANVEMDGTRFTNRVIWSDYKGPLSWDPSKPESIAGMTDLDYGETILAGGEIGDYFFIFTDRRIWQLSVKSDGTFNFTKRFTPDKTGDSCLFYRNTLISSGREIYYFGKDGFYSFSQYRPAPERLDIPHLGTANIFHETRAGTISPEWCDNHVAGFNPTTKEVLISWVPDTSETGFPESTFVFNVAYNHTSEIDHGFTAFIAHQSDTSGTLRDYLLEICACTIAELTANGSSFIKEGLPRSVVVDDCPEFDSVVTEDALVVDGSSLEDPDGEVSEDALCHAIGKIANLCGGCPNDYTFVGACAVDWCLKQFSFVLSRERCTNPTAVGSSDGDGYTASVGIYALDGYLTRITSMAMDFRDSRSDKILRRFEIEGIPGEQDIPSTLSLSIGQSHQVVDPLNDQLCGIMWQSQDDFLLECQSVSVSQHVEDGSRANETIEWPLYLESLYFYFDIQIDGTGGAFEMARFTMDVDGGSKAGPIR